MRKTGLFLSCIGTFLCAVVLIVLVNGCTSARSVKEPTPITVTVAGKEVATITEKNKWNGGVIDRADTFQTLMKNKTAIPDVEIGSTAEIAFNGTMPDHFTVTDILIDEAGNRIYNEKVDSSVPVTAGNQKYTFQITKNWASLLSSQYVEGKKDLRGYRMIASWGANECEYAFIIKTDAY